MRFRNIDTDPYTAWEPYQTTKAWTLISGAGTKNVRIQFMDRAGISDSDPVKAGTQGYVDSISLETAAPTGSLLINNGAATTTTWAVTLNLSATDTGGSGLGSMRFRNADTEPYSAWEPYQTTKVWALAGGEGAKTVDAQFMDQAGNISDSDPATAGAQGFVAEILCDATAPTGSILVNNGAPTTSTWTVTLNLSATDTGAAGSGRCGSGHRHRPVYCVGTLPDNQDLDTDQRNGNQESPLPVHGSGREHLGLGSGQGGHARLHGRNPLRSSGADRLRRVSQRQPGLSSGTQSDGSRKQPAGTGTPAPKPFDNGTWGYNVNGHGANGDAINTPKEEVNYPNLPRVFIPYLTPNAACVDCHDISQPSRPRAASERDPELGGREVNPSENTAHLRTDGTYPFIISGSNDWGVQIAFDTRMLHAVPPGGDGGHPSEHQPQPCQEPGTRPGTTSTSCRRAVRSATWAPGRTARASLTRSTAR